jgi:hypothetical protein
VFTSAREFREESVKVMKLVIRESGKSLWSSDEDGFETTTSVKKDRKLIREQRAEIERLREKRFHTGGQVMRHYGVKREGES